MIDLSTFDNISIPIENQSILEFEINDNVSLIYDTDSKLLTAEWIDGNGDEFEEIIDIDNQYSIQIYNTYIDPSLLKEIKSIITI